MRVNLDANQQGKDCKEAGSKRNTIQSSSGQKVGVMLDLQTNWRKPKGIDHHQRKQKSRGRPGLVKVGYGGPKEARGLHPSGFTDNLVYNLNDLEKLDPKKDGVRFGHSVGTKKRKEIVAKAVEGKFKIFNARVNVSGSKS